MRNVRQSVAQVQLVTFRLGAEEFGLDVFTVHEILRYQPVTSVPRAPRFVEGVLDVRGAVIPILDLRKRFELARLDTDEETRIVLVDFEGERLGLVVDAVTEVLRVPETLLAPPPKYFKGLSQEFIRGIVRMEHRLVVLIDLQQVLSSDERIALQETDFAAARAEAADAAPPTAPETGAPGTEASSTDGDSGDAGAGDDAPAAAVETAGDASSVETASGDAGGVASSETGEGAETAEAGKAAGRAKRGGKRA